MEATLCSPLTGSWCCLMPGQLGKKSSVIHGMIVDEEIDLIMHHGDWGGGGGVAAVVSRNNIMTVPSPDVGEKQQGEIVAGVLGWLAWSWRWGCSPPD